MFRIRALMWIWESNNDEEPHCNILQPSTFIRVWKGIIRGLGEVQLLGKLLQLHTSMAGFPLSILQNLMFYGCYGFGEERKNLLSNLLLLLQIQQALWSWVCSLEFQVNISWGRTAKVKRLCIDEAAHMLKYISVFYMKENPCSSALSKNYHLSPLEHHYLFIGAQPKLIGLQK